MSFITITLVIKQKESYQRVVSYDVNGTSKNPCLNVENKLFAPLLFALFVKKSTFVCVSHVVCESRITKVGALLLFLSDSEKPRIFTKTELWKNYRGEASSKGLYLAFFGRVYDVSEGKQYYAPGGGYDFFAGLFSHWLVARFRTRSFLSHLNLNSKSKSL